MNFFIKNKLKVLSFVLVFIALFSIKTKSIAMLNYQTVGTPTGIVTATTLNIRQGPGSSYKVISQVYKGNYVRVFAKIGSFYVVQTDSNYIGAASSSYIKLIYPSASANDTNKENTNTETTSGLTVDEQEVFDLINAKRAAARIRCIKD